MLRRFLPVLSAVAMLVPLLVACAPQSDLEAANEIRLYQVLPVAREQSKLAQSVGEGEVIAITNAGKAAHTLSQWTVRTSLGQVVLPKLTLAPNQVIYLADNAKYFRAYWNRSPNFEFGRDTDSAVPDLKLPDGKPPIMNGNGDVVRLLDDNGGLVDIFVFGFIENPPAPWIGPAAQFINSFPVTAANQVFTRLKHQGVLDMAPRASSWSGGTPTEPRRVWFAGQSDFPVKSVSGEMTLVAASAPDNAGPMLFDLVDRAKRSIRLVGYPYTNQELGRHLIDAVKRGVKVQVGIERNPGNADLHELDKQAQELLARGGVDVLYLYEWDGDLSARYSSVGSQYAIFDDESVLIASGNWTDSVDGESGTCDNREWVMVVKNNPDVVGLVKEVWDFDFGSGAKDQRRWDEKLDAQEQPDTHDNPEVCLPYTATFSQPLVLTDVQAGITRILSPDNSLDQEQGFLGMLHDADTELLINANAIDLWWGSASRPANLTECPNPYIAEIVAAARRGVTVKVIFGRKSVRADNLRDTQYAAKYLNDLAKTEKLNLEARLINIDGSGIVGMYHNHALIVDGSVVISSIKGSESSFRYARELAFKVDGVPEFTSYYRELFTHDWEASRVPNEPWDLRAQALGSGTLIER